MYIDVRIPYDEEGRLARAYNRALADGISEWVLFLDHDIFLCNPFWYEMCQEAVSYLARDPLAACVGCECGGEHHRRTMKENGAPTDQLNVFIDLSRKYYLEYGNMLKQIHEHIPGYFMLLKRTIAQEIVFKQDHRSINNIDVDFGQRLLEAGYHNYHMLGLFIYHRRGMKHLKKEFTNG